MSNTEIIQNLLERPDAYLIWQEVAACLSEEQQQRKEFYEKISEQQKAEFINGQIIFQSPVMKLHNAASLALAQLMSVYVNKHQAGFVGIEKILISLTRNDYEPDICFFRQEKAAHFKEEQMRFPAPDWIVEVLSKSTTEIDRGIKFNDYEAHQVEEYWIIDPETQVLEQYLLEDKKYQLRLKAKEGTVSSQALKGFNIPIQAIFDATLNLSTLQQLI